MTSKPVGMSRATTLLFAMACGTVIANIYYSQPLLAMLGRDFGQPAGQLGQLVTLTQLGYAGGLLLLVPLGDVLDRRKLIVCLLSCSVLALLVVAASPGLAWFSLASVLLGASTCAAQLLVPFAASLAQPAQRGRVLGSVMSGLLLGILLARVIAGLIAQWSSWRAVYLCAALAVALLTVALLRALPRDPRSAGWNYRHLMGSLFILLRNHPSLRLRSVYGALAFACFSVFWTALTFFLSQAPYHFSEGQIGAFGLAGAAGTMAASGAGRMADRGRGALATGLFSATILLSFGFIYLGTQSLVALVAGVLLLDTGVQGLHISNQGVIYALDEHARGRITSIYLTGYFMGGAAGSSVASLAFGRWGWGGVCVAGAAFATTLLALWFRVGPCGSRGSNNDFRMPTVSSLPEGHMTSTMKQ